MKLPFLFASALVFAPLATQQVSAHCQIPCGIYDDANVLGALHTDFVTIEKATKLINELSADPAANAHQLTRWINNKESHAQNIQDVVSAYFLAQRIKLPADDADEATMKEYTAQVALSHKVIVLAMKCKQKADPEAVEALHNALHDFIEMFSPEEEG